MFRFFCQLPKYALICSSAFGSGPRGGMDRAGRWLRSFLGGKKEQVANEENKKKKKQAAVPAPTGKERRRWSFRRSVDGNRMKEVKSTSATVSETEYEQKRRQHALAIAAATKTASEAAEAAAQAAAVVVRLTRPTVFQTHSAVKIQTVFRSYLARKALRALKGIVKLQSLIRGQLLRNFFKIPAIARPPRFLTGKEAQVIMTMISKRQLEFKKSTHRHRTSSALPSSSSPHRHYHRQQNNHHRREYDDDDVCHFEEPSYYHSAMTSFSESIDDAMHCYAVSNPSYMANTQSSKAKARSQSTPRLRPCSPSRRSLMGSINEGDYYHQRSLLPYEIDGGR
ncbi:hypothetical protein ZOSMA_95G00080 [Zostera marina]|uniref:DUF4005 domain-containing protein n=1 Tax=Zostera marina TaxID=29655 RepID=A0A0K9NI25_ZOSMR|nr:hypothetical protein ZOSMA_95G00080 [Zostera marina]